MPNATQENGQTESDTPAVHPTESSIEVSPARRVSRWEGMVVINAVDPDGPMEPDEALSLAVALTKAAAAAKAGDPIGVRHAVWCSPGAHARAARECDEGHPGCVGREIYMSIGDDGTDGVRREIGGFWRQDEGGEPHFAAEWDLKLANLDIGTILSLYKLFLALSWDSVGRLTNMLGELIDEYEGGDAWREAMP